MLNFVKKLEGYYPDKNFQCFFWIFQNKCDIIFEFEGVLALLGHKYCSTKFLWHPVYFILDTTYFLKMTFEEVGIFGDV